MGQLFVILQCYVVAVFMPNTLMQTVSRLNQGWCLNPRTLLHYSGLTLPPRPGAACMENKWALCVAVKKGREIGEPPSQINLRPTKGCVILQRLWRMTEPPSLDQSRYKSVLKPGALLHWAMYLHCLTHDPSTDPMTAQAAPKLIPRHWEVFLAPTDLQNQQQALCWRRASEHLAL